MDDDPTQLEIQLEINTLYDGWNKCLSAFESKFYLWTQKTFNYLKVSGKFEISVVLCDDNHIRVLNAEHRNKDKSTNILSFPTTHFNNPLFHINDYPLLLGDLAISFETVEAEALLQHKSFNDHLCHLWIHGLLHLVGYDHEADEQAVLMENTETEILKLMSIDNPYQILEKI